MINLEHLRIVALAASLLVIFGGGWAALLHLRIRQLEKVKDKVDDLDKALSEHKLADALTYASKADLKESLLKIEVHLEKMEANFDKRMEGMSAKMESAFRAMSDEVKDLAKRVRTV